MQNNDTYTSLGSVGPMRHRSKCFRSVEVPDTYIVLKMCFNISFLFILENVLLLSSNVVEIGYLAIWLSGYLASYNYEWHETVRRK